MISQKSKKMLRNLDFTAQNMINFMFIQGTLKIRFRRNNLCFEHLDKRFFWRDIQDSSSLNNQNEWSLATGILTWQK